MVLTNAIKKKLLQQAHGLKPVVLIGKHGLTDSVIQEINVSLEAHELIKIRLPKLSKDEQTQIINTITENLMATTIQSIGSIIVLYRKKNKKTSEN